MKISVAFSVSYIGREELKIDAIARKLKYQMFFKHFLKIMRCTEWLLFSVSVVNFRMRAHKL